MTIYKMYASANPADALATLDIVADGRIVAIGGYMDPAYAGADGSVRSELSFASSSGFASNDTRSSFWGMASRHDFTTSGGVQSVVNEMVTGLDIPVALGERLYLHATGTAVTTIFTIWLYVEDKQGSAGRRIRQ